MIITGKSLSRRTLLKGAGTVIALPMLDAMIPAFAKADKKPVRLSVAYVPNGMVMDNWTPKSVEAGFELPSILKSLEPYREQMMVFTGLALHNGNDLGDGGGDHARAGGSFMTGVHPRKTMGADIRNGISFDQVAAQALGAETRFPSLELGCDDMRTTGNCDTGYSCSYTNSLAWRTPTTPLPPENNPRAVFERLFGSLDTNLNPAARAELTRDRRSVLDFVNERTASLVGKLGPSDKHKIDEYLYAIREIEKRIERAEQDNPDVAPSMEKPDGIPVDYADHVKLMYDLQVIAFQADLTRISTLIYAREASPKTYPQIGVPDGHHPVSHHRNDPVNLAKLTKINTFHVELFSHFIDKLATTQDGDGTLLDHSMVLYGSGLSDSNRHLHENLPILLFGRGDGSLKQGRHIRYEKETPLTNLYLTLLDRMGVQPETIGDSTGKLAQLTQL